MYQPYNGTLAILHLMTIVAGGGLIWYWFFDTGENKKYPLGAFKETWDELKKKGLIRKGRVK
ncbi:MAG TPA: hypothetical protein ENH87_11200 [Pricia antarctica]|uniref:Uncharacterized protein n=1 Tax=Pricia antarctica TaxID=641691 RepID=A0A831QMM3_9FLAO|nr:hypothetical protein [Pricia antarctica]